MSALASSFFVVLPVLFLYMYFVKKDKNAYSFAVAIVVFYAVSNIVKLIVKEPRPCDTSSLSWINSYSCESGYAFPSSHATTLTGLAFFFRGYKVLSILYTIWLVVVLFGRVYLGQHYLTDVLVGIVLSIAIYYVISIFKTKINDFLNSIVKKIIPKIAIK
jgi:undecaprenyl-diphosphatase